MKIIINITDKDIENYKKYSEDISDYPFYVNGLSNISRVEYVALGKLARSGELSINENNNKIIKL